MEFKGFIYSILVITICINTVLPLCQPEYQIENVPAGYTKNLYTESEDMLLNPGRGFLEEFFISETNFDVLTRFKLDALRIISGITLVLRHYLLSDFRTGFISHEFLDSLRRDLSAVDDAGFMAVLRFSYSKTYVKGGPYNDVDKKVMIVHIKQLAEIFKDFKSSILVVQAGFIGTWGEWYYTDHFGDPSKQIYKWEDRKEVINTLLKAVPREIQVQLRTPFFKQKLFRKTATTSDDVSKHDVTSRIGFHNDCFLASKNDKGTYQNYVEEYPYMVNDTNFVVMGGETCEISKSGRHLCPSALRELKELHFTFLAQSYNKEVLDLWKKEDPVSCYDLISSRLGYRFTLKHVILPDHVRPGRDLTYHIVLENVGYAASVIKMDVYLVLHLVEYYKVRIPTDTRIWGPGNDIELSGVATVPRDLPWGTYKVYLVVGKSGVKIPKSDDLVLFANEGVPIHSAGLNDLQHSIVVTGTNNGPFFHCRHQFEPWHQPVKSMLPRVYVPSTCVKTALPNSGFEDKSDWMTFNDDIIYHHNASEAYHGTGYIELKKDNAAYQLMAFPIGITKMAVRAYSRHSGEVIEDRQEYSIYCDVWLHETNKTQFGLYTPFKAVNGTTWHSALLMIDAPQGLKNANCYVRYNDYPTNSSAFLDEFEIWILSGTANFTDCDFIEKKRNIGHFIL